MVPQPRDVAYSRRQWYNDLPKVAARTVLAGLTQHAKTRYPDIAANPDKWFVARLHPEWSRYKSIAESPIVHDGAYRVAKSIKTTSTFMVDGVSVCSEEWRFRVDLSRDTVDFGPNQELSCAR